MPSRDSYGEAHISASEAADDALEAAYRYGFAAGRMIGDGDWDAVRSSRRKWARAITSLQRAIDALAAGGANGNEDGAQCAQVDQDGTSATKGGAGCP